MKKKENELDTYIANKLIVKKTYLFEKFFFNCKKLLLNENAFKNTF